MSELDINLAYLTVTGHRDTDVLYDNIVALNVHAALLHYTKLDHQPPSDIFFFQAEDGIRDHGVTGVQTCALPISPRRPGPATGSRSRARLQPVRRDDAADWV